MNSEPREAAPCCRQLHAPVRRRRQAGIALLVLVFVLGIVAVAALYSGLDTTSVRISRENATQQALKRAKEALIAYSSNSLTAGTCTTNCPRPGDLPCPDTSNTGSAGTSCGSATGSNQSLRIGRLPWKTLGIEDLRDGYGERLWYAVSNNFKNNTRTLPLNSDTVGTITVRDAGGASIYETAAGNGVAAVVFSPGPAIQRQDGVNQARSTTQENTASNYLDNALGEDNADFVDSSSTNGFILGPVYDSQGREILNDRLILLTRDDMATAMEQRVAQEVRNALLDYYCGSASNADYSTRSCLTTSGNRFYPSPAQFNDNSCLGNSNISSGCDSHSSESRGRIPANNLSPDWDSSSILRSVKNNNWFQQNGWRELVFYAVAPACGTGYINCNGGGGLLTLNGALESSTTKQAIVISAGRSIGTQSRTTTSAKQSEVNYLDGENYNPLDNVYARANTSSDFNDRALSIP